MNLMFRKRYRRILWFFGWTILSVIGWDLILPHLGLRRWSRATRPERMKRHAQRFRRLAVEMGGVMIKVGQFMSSRLDVLPREITDELSGLQDEVAAEPFEPIRALVESEFGMPLAEKFCEFSQEPLAAASIGQVYHARLCEVQQDGTPCPPVVVKVQRSHIEEIVNVDLSALRIVGGWLQKYPPIGKRANMPKLLEEFSLSLYEEIDYLHEGKNAETFAENFKGDDRVRVPRVIWSHTTKRVLTLEDVGGIKINDYAAIETAGVDRREVAKKLLDSYLKQVFEDGFFHADPHPGNLFVQPPLEGQSTKEWKLTFVDFGMAGTLPERTFKSLREALIALGTQDVHRLVQTYTELGILLPGANLEEIERASRQVFEQLWGKSTRQMVKLSPEEAREFITEFGDLIYKMPFQIPENLILLGRCISILAGISMGLDPDFNIWEGVTPYATKLMEAEKGGKWGTILDEGLTLLQNLIALPGQASTLIDHLEQGRLEVRMPSLSNDLAKVTRSQRKIAGAIIFAAFLLGGVQFFIAGAAAALTISFSTAAGAVLLWVLLAP